MLAFTVLSSWVIISAHASTTMSRSFGYAKDSGQTTICEQLVLTGQGEATCTNPSVIWGGHTGVPHEHRNNNFDAYCKSLGYASFVTESNRYGTRSCSKGALFWCKGYDNPTAYHW